MLEALSECAQCCPHIPLTNPVPAELSGVPEFQFELLRCSVLSLPHVHWRVLAHMCQLIHRTAALLTAEDARQTVRDKLCYRLGLCFVQQYVPLSLFNSPD